MGDDKFLELFEDLDMEIKVHFAPSRERSLALTALEQAYLWLTRAEPEEEGE